jgi:hypothetical protein
MTIDFSTSEMRAAWRDARWLLINAEFAGFGLFKVAGDSLAEADAPMSMSSWILLGLACFSLVASVASGLSLLRMDANKHLGKSRVFIFSALAFLCGSTLGGALAWLRASGFQLDRLFENPVPARVVFFLLLIAAGWLISTALVPLLLNRRSLQ